MKVIVTPRIFKGIVSKRFKSEIALLKARLGYRKHLNDFRYEEDDFIRLHACPSNDKNFRSHLKKELKRAEKKKDCAKKKLEKQLN